MLGRYHITREPELKRKAFHYYFIILVLRSGCNRSCIFNQTGQQGHMDSGGADVCRIYHDVYKNELEEGKNET